jgi:DNA-directed RNA polymerase subunit RPC12/RpoP
VTEKRKDNNQPHAQAQTVHKTCPHCGHKLSPWQQVLLSVDRALVCKNCWYRIILEIDEDRKTDSPSPDKE